METFVPSPRRPEAPRSQPGFTLVELLVTLAISAIVLGIGVPSFVTFIANNSVRSSAADLHSMLTFARSEAIKRNADVVLTPTARAWKNGFTITTTVGGSTSTLAKQAAFSGIDITSATSTVTYRSDGRIQGGAPPSFEITGSSSTRCVSVSLSGLPKAKTGSCQ